MAATPLDPNNLSLGPGYVWYAPLATAEPADVAAAFGAGWVKLGYSKDGSTFTFDAKMEKIMVAEELPPVRWDITDQDIGLAVELAEETQTTWKQVLQGGSATTNANGVNIEPLSPSTAPTRYMIAWQSFAGDVRIILRRALSGGAVSIKRAKSPTYATFPLTYKCELVSGSRPFVVQLATART